MERERVDAINAGARKNQATGRKVLFVTVTRIATRKCKAF